MSEPYWDHIRQFCADIRTRLGSRRARTIGSKLFKTLRTRLGWGEAKVLAESICGVPVDRLTAREACEALRAHGVRVTDRKLAYRLKEKYHLAAGTMVFLLDRRGRCSPETAGEIQRPIVKLTVGACERGLFCQVEPFQRSAS